MCARGIVIITCYIVVFSDSSWRKITLAVPMPGLLSAARLPHQSDIKMLVIKMFFVHLCRLQNLFKDTKFDHTLGGHCNTRGQTSNLLWLPPFIFGPTCHAYVALQGRVHFLSFFLSFFFTGARPKDTKRHSRRTSWILPPPSIHSASSEQLFLACNTFTAPFHL